MKVALLTAAIGTRRFAPLQIETDADCYAFIEGDTKTPGWNQRQAIRFSSVDKRWSARRDARFHKILPEFLLPDYDGYIWVDSKWKLLRDPCELFHQYDQDFILFRHPRKGGIREEAKKILELDYDEEKLVSQQLSHHLYQSAGQDCYATGLLLKRRNKRTLRLSLSRWEHLCRFSSRDQLSLPMVLTRSDCSVAEIPCGSHLFSGWLQKI